MAGSVNMENTRVEGIDYSTGIPVSVDIVDGYINGISYDVSEKINYLPFIAPGLFDIQVNGINGTDFNTSTVTHDDIHSAVRSLYSYGITSFFPTLVTAPANDLRESLRKISSFCESHPDEGRAIAGVHLEGPFISGDDGPRGAHDKRFISLPDIDLLKEWQENCNGIIRLITLAPELQGAFIFIGKCCEMGITVSIGHTSATPQQIKDAVSAGARMSTHLGNGAHLMLPRHPNYIWEQLAQDDLWATVISDGFHLPDSVLKVMYRAKSGKMILISDCTRFAGLPAGSYSSKIGGNVILSESGRLYMAEKPELLAGSAVSLLCCVNHMLNAGICSLPQAWNMASVFPTQFIEPDSIYGLQKGSVADIVLFKLVKKKIEILKTVKNGRIVYENPELLNSDI